MLKNTLAAASGLLLTAPAFAHPGHDHAHWLSDPIHLLTALAIAAVAVTGVVVAKRKKAKLDK
ncbi:hypothetical protein A3715_16490 [Oleiphilus sp. HI0009]|uniref:hypothetical protein n=1 Tax=unclassified Oleiphilus TaxID=2631174 RepID=UPI0007C2711D|nr:MULTISPECIES: hypothetical protein [unclassified Oleiphilus]KZX81280.1 hypothetical protein A3715_18965 [Oleiphilus sp. HI0009]MCH2157347.1 hypothetical protein [Oleiphilaceae bacterium]KZX86202.1 hypothetical protein A3715_16490 [Oleiphilus sp. HI0009]KZY68964.1 hypothetical protein A3739_09825 [Oleiphilus sp. HI0067]KZY70018.1 hypothetical protein A3738_03985 [Oleiphilus sp. HI0066]